jgi:hypothetical protein
VYYGDEIGMRAAIKKLMVMAISDKTFKEAGRR